MKVEKLLDTVKRTDGNLLVMVGVPLSGKSTFIEKLIDTCGVISRDELVLAAGKGLSYSDAFNTVDQKRISGSLKYKMIEAGKTNENFIIDMTNLKPKSRKGVMKNFPNHIKIAVVLDTPARDVLLERNEKRGIEEDKLLPVGVIDTMLGNFVFPTKEEGFDHIVQVK